MSKDPGRILIFDTTLRDGEQSPGASLNLEEKLAIAHQLARLGVDIIEAGFPFASPGDFKAVNKIPTLTMYAYAKMGENNYSNNPTFLENLDETSPISHLTKNQFSEAKNKIKKINKSPYADHEEKFENITYISKIGIYDKNKNLIAVATLANPAKKTEKRDYMFKIGIDF